jgi:hypothetical protein
MEYPGQWRPESDEDWNRAYQVWARDEMERQRAMMHEAASRYNADMAMREAGITPAIDIDRPFEDVTPETEPYPFSYRTRLKLEFVKHRLRDEAMPTREGLFPPLALDRSL